MRGRGLWVSSKVVLNTGWEKSRADTPRSYCSFGFEVPTGFGHGSEKHRTVGWVDGSSSQCVCASWRAVCESLWDTGVSDSVGALAVNRCFQSPAAPCEVPRWRSLYPREGWDTFGFQPSRGGLPGPLYSPRRWQHLSTRRWLKKFSHSLGRFVSMIITSQHRN